MTATPTTHPAPVPSAAPAVGHGLAALLRETRDDRAVREEIALAVAATGLTLAEASAHSERGNATRERLAARVSVSPARVREAIATTRALRRLDGVHRPELAACLGPMPRERYSARDLFGLLDGSRVPARPVTTSLMAGPNRSEILDCDSARSTSSVGTEGRTAATVSSAVARELLAAAGIPADRVPGVAESTCSGRALWCAPATAQVDTPARRETYPTLVVAETARAHELRLQLLGAALAAGIRLDGPAGYREDREAITLAARQARSSRKAIRHAVRYEAALRLLEEQADPEYRRLLADHKPVEMTAREIGQLARRTHMPAEMLIDLCEAQIAAGNTDWSALADRLELCGCTHLQRLIGQREQSSYTKNGRRYEGRARRVVPIDLAGQMVSALGIPPVELPGL